LKTLPLAASTYSIWCYSIIIISKTIAMWAEIFNI